MIPMHILFLKYSHTQRYCGLSSKPPQQSEHCIKQIVILLQMKGLALHLLKQKQKQKTSEKHKKVKCNKIRSACNDMSCSVR